MRRVIAILLMAGVVGGIATLGTGASNDAAGNEYRVVFDNAFGLVTGGDLKIAGVRAGKISKLQLEPKTNRALVSFKVTENGFGSMRADSSCEVLPQSLVGEYFVDCQPGESKKVLRPGGTIPVERTSSTVPPDLVNNIQRKPYREKLRYIIGELGAGVAGNADNLNEALRRASPALRETNKVLAILAEQNQVLADLSKNADDVLGDLAENRTDVTRFVDEARQTAQVSASRDRDIAAGFRRLPGFLRELQPTMRQLGTTVDAQGPALRNLSRSSGQLERLFDNLEPFAKASRPGFEALGRSSDAGREAVRSATPTVSELNRFSQGVPELGKNLAIILEHLDDRKFAAEKDPRSPGGEGYTGLEALLTYIFDQTLSTNVHDGENHILKVQAFESECGPYADIKAAKELGNRCSTALGPNQIGLNFPDETAPEGYDGADRGRPEEDPDRDPKPSERNGQGGDAEPMKIPGLDEMLPGAPAPSSERDRNRDSAPAPAPGPAPKLPQTPPAPEAPPAPATPPVPEAPKVQPPQVRGTPEVTLSARGRREDAQTQLLEYLFGS